MKNSFRIFPAMICFLFPVSIVAQTGKVGINTTTPQAMLHVKDSNVLFSGTFPLPATPGNPPASGLGTRMMWYPEKAAFRVGFVQAQNWDEDNIGSVSFASGNNTKASGSFSTAMGFLTEASGTYSTAIGYGTEASGNSSISMGVFANSVPFASFVIGRYNDSIATSNKIDWVDTDPVFIIGNGPSGILRRNAFIIAKNAETGINIANGLPQALLHLKARENTSNMHIRLENLSNSSYTTMYYNGSDMTFRTFTSGNQYVWRNSFNTANMYLQHGGDLYITGSYLQLSDKRLKENISPLQNSLQKIIQLGGYHYNWIDKSRDNHVQTGLLAQQVETQMPELVKTNEEGTKTVNYNGMIPYLIEAIKELKGENEFLKNEVLKLKKAKR